jgi:tRNA(adenine34) deaminase
MTSADNKSGKKSGKKTGGKRWVRTVTSDSTHPPEGLFTRSPEVIARELASKKVSPKGAVSGLRMLTYFINRGGKGLSSARRASLERAKALLSERIHRAKGSRAKKAA